MSSQIFTLPDELLEFKKSAERFAEKLILPNALSWDDDPAQFPEKLVREGAQAGLLSYHLPVIEEDRLGPPVFPGLLPTVVLMEELAAKDAGAAMIFGAHILGSLPLALIKDAAAERFIPDILASIESPKPALMALALHESEAAEVWTTASKVEDGYAINGRKRLVRLGNVAGHIMTLVTRDTDAGPAAWALALIPVDTQGCYVERVEKMLGQNICPMADVLFENCVIPRGNLLAKNKAQPIIEEVLAAACAINAAVAIGTARGGYQTAIHYAAERYQGSKMIIEHDAVSGMLTDMQVRIAAARGGLLQAAAHPNPSRKELALSKIYSSEMAVQCCLDAVQVLGGYGYMHEYGQEIRIRDAQMTVHYEETNQSLRQLVNDKTREELEI